ncbi:type II toxin-antitoxin system VapB family antitoxin [Tomitella gaofuii]|uniref:type II toxin-antitoxin system VapB family antitoxin n=1 Tax=Tomitella gaofuii TaxID=2760083 RepID=UPI0015FACEE8|nr:ribbon-helix-helix protein, CopG family [Tomitella gaofuii]
MADILIRGLDEATVAEIDRRAAESGQSRAEFLRRRLDVEFRSGTDIPVTVDDWRRFGAAAADLGDPSVMGEAWS